MKRVQMPRKKSARVAAAKQMFEKEKEYAQLLFSVMCQSLPLETKFQLPAHSAYRSHLDALSLFRKQKQYDCENYILLLRLRRTSKTHSSLLACSILIEKMPHERRISLLFRKGRSDDMFVTNFLRRGKDSLHFSRPNRQEALRPG